MNSRKLINSSEQVIDSEELPTEGISWQNPGEFPQFNSEKAAHEKAVEAERIKRETFRSEAERQYQEELSRPYENNGGQEGLTKFPVKFDGKTIDGYEFNGSEFKMLVSVVGAVGQSLGTHPREIDLDKWTNSPRDYISTSLVSNKIMNLFDKEGLIFGFNNPEKGDLLSTTPVDYGVLDDIGRISQYEDQAMGPSELLEITDTKESLTPWNEVRLNGGATPDSIIVFGKTKEDISDESKRAAIYFGVPIYLIRTDVFGEPKDRHDSREVTDDVKEFWNNRNNPNFGRMEQEKSALLEEVGTYFETGEVGERIAKYLGGYEDEMQSVKDNSQTRDDFAKNLIAALGQDKMKTIKAQIEDNVVDKKI